MLSYIGIVEISQPQRREALAALGWVALTVELLSSPEPLWVEAENRGTQI